jgi:DNA-binding transcriptional regulator YiaG
MTPAEIRRLRLSLGLTQNGLAAELGYTGKYRWTSVWRLEAGQRKPSGPS